MSRQARCPPARFILPARQTAKNAADCAGTVITPSASAISPPKRYRVYFGVYAQSKRVSLAAEFSTARIRSPSASRR